MAKWRYGVILDAGSSGTRLHIYKWLDIAAAREEAGVDKLRSLPVLTTEKKWTKKVHPGISTFGGTPDRVGPEHLKPLLQHALHVVPRDAVADTPFFLLATAGMRLLPPLQQTTLLKHICAYARAESAFQIPDCDSHIQVLAGETEGLYGWIAVNYLLGGFDFDEHAGGKRHPTYGFLDMGGASAQIAFAPNKTEAVRHADDLKLLRMRTLDGAVAEFGVFVTSWLGFGVNEARRRYVEALLKASHESNPTQLEDPCLPEGLRTTTEDDVLLSGTTVAGKNPYLIGGGRFDRCLNLTYPLLEKDVVCKDEPCLLSGVHVPAIDFDVNRFVGISEYWHTTHAIFEKEHKDKAYDFNTYQQRISEFCSRDWESIHDGIDRHTWGKKVTEQTAVKVCFKASWLINILYEGIGIPRVGLESTSGSEHNGTKEVLHSAKEKGFTESFQPVNKIDDTEVSWTMGKMILYASSQIPPRGDPLPVGFGSNAVSGVPSDFQLGGSVLSSSSPTPISIAKNATASSQPPSDRISDENDWHDTLFMGESPRRIPGFLLFVLIMCLAAFLLCGRDRRKSVYRRIFRGSPSLHPHARPRKRRFFSPLKVPFFRSSSSAAYERVLEDGPASDRFELGSLGRDVYDSEGEGADNEHSDDSVGSWTGKSSGWATPRIVGGAGNGAGGLAGGGAGDYFGTGSGGAGGVMGKGIGLGILGRSGLVGRTESRERLVGMTGGGGVEAATGRRSRKVSPVRGGRGGLGVLSED
ncbi:Golgi apyrase [Pseudocyphellaria aurata]|nr:Golgi apyrase [Pseudocyphellaria aurata]